MEDVARLVAPIAITVAALVTASNLGARITGIGFVIFTIGSVAWFIVGLTTGQGGLMWQNVVLFFINIFGVWRWLGRRAAMEKGGEDAQRQSEEGAGQGLVPLSKFVGMELCNTDGTKVGGIVDAMLGERDGRLVYALASTGGVAGAGESLHRVDWRELRLADGSLRLGESAAALGTRPAVERDHWPSA
ncbi:PRC-barrel domain-containing protein [Sphingomicrobium aestuariivivum]|uniref:PRC-barrel domain-containing protein n=1 Tax=Sphingomicrobium aestuariivivum TaxID=1582356 RepID=UPI001FD6C026|nr:PRC-barrel domain-containing protein [Sphingomicrobium aestuariivivum]MCJ8189773.1 PRC-barrel domain-containing protein [Sphingomicrobium aestuariivivum]